VILQHFISFNFGIQFKTTKKRRKYKTMLTFSINEMCVIIVMDYANLHVKHVIKFFKKRQKKIIIALANWIELVSFFFLLWKFETIPITMN
jgi:hypothetical protein